MAEKLVEFLKDIINNDSLIVFLISTLPLIELKGAIPIGALLGKNLIQSSGIAYLGSTFVCIPVFFLLIPIFNLLKKIGFIKKLVLKIENMFYNKAKKISEKANESGEDNFDAIKKIKIISLFIFVAVPFPVTGIWTGTAISVFLNLKFKDAFLPLAFGNLVAGTLITIMTLIFGKYVDIIIYVLFAIAIIMLIITITKIALSKPKNNDKEIIK